MNDRRASLELSQTKEKAIPESYVNSRKKRNKNS